MMRITFLSFLYFVLFYVLSFPANHYVDKNALGQNNGTSWTNAWESISAIQWGSIQPGDIIYISGGTDSTVYNEHLVIQASGTADDLVTIRNSYDTGHSGKVILDGQNYTGTGIRNGSSVSDNPDYIYIKGLVVRNYQIGVYVNFRVNVITLDSLIIENNYGRAINVVAEDGFTEGIMIDSVTIKNCHIVTPVDVNAETDGIYLKYVSNAVIHDNYVHIANGSDVNRHSDGIQTNPVQGMRFYNNVMICDSNTYGITYIAGAASDDGVGDSVIIYNNYFYAGGIWRNGAEPWVTALNPEFAQRWATTYGKQAAPHFIAHNTVVVQGPWYAGCHIVSPSTMVNNIIVQFEGSASPVTPPANGFDYSGGYLWLETFRNTSVPAIDSIKNNLMWTEWSTGKFRGGPFEGSKAYSWSQWTSRGGTGVNGDPLFVDPIGYMENTGELTGELQSGSPAINQGLDIQDIIENLGLPWTDINGNPRDSSPDIGAYQFTGGGGGGNSPPNQPNNPTPPDGGLDQQINSTLSWTCSDPDGDPIVYDVYFGTNFDPSLVSSNHSICNYDPGTLVNNTTYYWKIVAKDNQGHSTTGNIWNFTTIENSNQPPNSPHNPDPPDNSTDKPVNQTLSWNCTDPDGDPLTYDLYFGTTPVPPLKTQNLSTSSFYIENLETNTNYYWRVVAKDNQAASTAGPVWEFTTITGDIAPPEVVGVTINDSVTVIIQFSEPLNEVTAEDIQNYEISPSITVLSAVLSGTDVALSTSVHSQGVYQITVTNVTDLAGNVITPPNNSANYEYVSNSNTESNLNVIIYLEGPYFGDHMSTQLNDLNFLPLSQPFDANPWNYFGAEQINQIPVDVVDWILLEVRLNLTPTSVISRRAVFLRKDGQLVDIDGAEKVKFPGLSSGLYYLVIRHRNHMPIMSSVKVQFSDSPEVYDFTTSKNKAYGNDPMKELLTGKFGLYSADGNANGEIDRDDFRHVWRKQKGSFGYHSGDFNLDAGVNIKDKNEIYKHNKGKNSSVPE